MWKRPSLTTKFQIDHDWWKETGKDIRVTVRGQLCADCQVRFADHRNTEAVDWVDPESAEVVRADALLQCLRGECAKKPDFISRSVPVVTNVFRIFLNNGNQALTPQELHELMPWTGADAILRTLAGADGLPGSKPARLD